MSDDPGRDMIMALRDAGLFTTAEAESLDAWASDMATKVTTGEIDRAALDRLVLQRLMADIARRGRA